MSPGGHLLTTAAACSAVAVLIGSPEVTAGVALGGFCIDVDHAVDYVAFDRQRDLRPGAFLRYYVEGRARHLVLALHSYELFAALAVVAWWSGALWLAGYLAGGLMHLALDIAFNGQLTPRSIWAFYSFTYRARHRFAASALIGDIPVEPTSAHFWRDFFRGTSLQREADRHGLPSARLAASRERSRPARTRAAVAPSTSRGDARTLTRLPERGQSPRAVP